MNKHIKSDYIVFRENHNNIYIASVNRVKESPKTEKYNTANRIIFIIVYYILYRCCIINREYRENCILRVQNYG